MRYRFLGPVDVRTDDGWHAVRGGKARALLAVLLINANQNVPVERLIAELWPTDPPRSAGTLVRGQVLALRRALGDSGAAVLTTQARGYRLSIHRDDVDANRFEDLVNQGCAALTAGAAFTASRALSAALELWRGAPLADVPPTPMVVAHATRLAERRLDATEAWVEAILAQADSSCPDQPGVERGELIGMLRKLVELNPFRERFAGQLMRALQVADRRVEALDVYAEARRRLVDELGLDPGPELMRVHREILLTSPQPAPPAHAAEPDPAPRPLIPMQIPPDIADFTGRGTVLRHCREVLAKREVSALRVVVLTGAGGIGKSTLAVRLAHRLTSAYPDGQLYADLAGVRDAPVDPGHVLGQFLRALGVPPAAIPDSLADRASMYRDQLRDRRMLVVLDNAADQAQVRSLRPGSARCAVLITSRSRLAGLEGTSVVELAAFEPAESLELFRRIAGPERTFREPGLAESIVELCGHLPLAVRVAAARAGSLPGRPLERLAEALRDERRCLDQLQIGDLAVRASIAAGYQTLAEPSRRLFRLLGQFDAPDFTDWIAGAMAGMPPPPAEQALDTLVDARLVDAVGVDRTGQTRFRLSGLVRLFARERAAAEEPPTTVHVALASAFGALLAVAEDASSRLRAPAAVPARRAPTPQQPHPALMDSLVRDPLAWFDAERATLLAAVAQAGAAGHAELAKRLAAAMRTFDEPRVPRNDGLRPHEAAYPGRWRRAGRAGPTKSSTTPSNTMTTTAATTPTAAAGGGEHGRLVTAIRPRRDDQAGHCEGGQTGVAYDVPTADGVSVTGRSIGRGRGPPEPSPPRSGRQAAMLPT